MFAEAQALAKQENRTMSELLREALRQYQREREWEQIRSYGAMQAEMADVKNEEDVVNIVSQYRRERAQLEAERTANPAQANS
jgi:metal-responsive CopG/Arc/MetJ family transcriptional regulator